MEIEFPCRDLHEAGFSGLQLTGPGAPFSGPGTNLANLFNLTGITNRDTKETELWDTWIMGAAIAGQNVDTTLTVAVVDDLNHDGVFNDAPNVVPDLNHDGRVAQHRDGAVPNQRRAAYPLMWRVS
jgi:hypothetical protein